MTSVTWGCFYAHPRLTISQVWQFFSELLASAVLTGIVSRFVCGIVPTPLFVLMPTLLFTPFVVRDFARMEPELISAYGDVMMGIGAIIVGGVGLVGVNTWRRQLIGENEYQVSVQLQSLLFNLHYQVMDLRRGRYTSEDEMLKRIYEAGAAFEDEFRRARAHWGDEIVPYKSPITSAYADLRNAVHQRNLSAVDIQSDEWSDDGLLSDVYILDPLPDESDKFSQRWNTAINDLETFLKQYIKK